MAYSLSCLPPRAALAATDDWSSHYHTVPHPQQPRPASFTSLQTSIKSRLPGLSSFIKLGEMATSNLSSPVPLQVPTPTANKETQYTTDRAGSLPQGAQAWPDSIYTTTEVGSADRVSHSSVPPSPTFAFRPPSPVRMTDHPPAHDSASGIDWDSTSTALMLLSEACRRAQSPSLKPENARQLLLTATIWLLKSLPEQMTPRELAQIEEVLPTGLEGHLDDIEGEHDDSDGLNRKVLVDRENDRSTLLQCQRRRGARSRTSARQPQRSWLHRCIAFFILQLSNFLVLILPYIFIWIQTCYKLERRHRVTERALIRGMDLTNALGESGLQLRDAAIRLGHGKPAALVLRTGGWLMDSFVGGVADGAEQGVTIVGDAIKRQD